MKLKLNISHIQAESVVCTDLPGGNSYELARELWDLFVQYERIYVAL
jgi:hypothetical protein